MLSTLPKLATVMLAIFAVAFMGMSIAAYYGRPDPAAEISSAELAGYYFEAPPAGDGAWKVTARFGEDTSPSSHPNGFTAVVAAYSKENSRLKKLAGDTSQRATELQTRIDDVNAEQQQDIAAIDRRMEELNQIVKTLDAELQQQSQDLQKLSVDTLLVREETVRRRGDVIRFQHELEELRTDRFRLVELRRVLTDRLLRLELENQALDQRLEQLQQATGQ